MPVSPPHVIPYQGSKRRLAARICTRFPAGIDTLYEPFAGSAAVTIHAASCSFARRFVLGELCDPLAGLLRMLIEEPGAVIAGYSDRWYRGAEDRFDYFYSVRERFNTDRDPVDLLYLLCRAVKNSPRFSLSGNFNQPVDRRRLGTHPVAMRRSISEMSELLRGRTVVVSGDWEETASEAGRGDFVYLDPPYEGVASAGGRMYESQLGRESLIDGLRQLSARGVSFALSYDGMTGGKEYGDPLPRELGLDRFVLDAGISSQATLNGRSDETYESLYISRHGAGRTAAPGLLAGTAR